MSNKTKTQNDLLKHVNIEVNTPNYQKFMRLKKFEWFKEIFRLALLGYNVECMSRDSERGEK